MGSGPSRGVKSDINVTPLVDVVLVLLIIFMVVTPMLQRGKDVTLPKSQAIDEDGRQSDPLIVSVTKDKRIFVEADAYDEASLGERLRSEIVKAPGRKMLLKGDEALTFGDVRKVMEIARKSGARGVSLGVEQVKK